MFNSTYGIIVDQQCLEITNKYIIAVIDHKKEQHRIQKLEAAIKGGLDASWASKSTHQHGSDD